MNDSNTLKLTPSQLIELLALASPERPVLIESAPGIGKSDIVAQAATQLERELFVWHPVTWSPTDARGLPARNPNGTQADWLPYGDLLIAIEATEPTWILIDDLGQALPSVQAALMQVLLAREINGHKISPHVTFIACTNDRAHKAGCSPILEPLKGRMLITHLQTSVQDWMEWAAPRQYPEWLLAYVGRSIGQLHSFEATSSMTNSPTPRNVARVAEWLKAGGDKASYAIQCAILEGACGQAWRVEALAFQQVYAELPDLSMVCTAPESVPMPSEGSVRYATIAAVTKFVDHDTINNVAAYINRFTGEYGALFWQIALGRDESLCKTEAFNSFMIKNPETYRRDV